MSCSWGSSHSALNLVMKFYRVEYFTSRLNVLDYEIVQIWIDKYVLSFKSFNGKRVEKKHFIRRMLTNGGH